MQVLIQLSLNAVAISEWDETIFRKISFTAILGVLEQNLICPRSKLSCM